jgi:hypothetical protein
MNKVILGLVLGGILGAFDGLTAWFTPAVRNELLGIVIGSTIKGIIAGICIGYFARKVRSLPLGIVFGLGRGIDSGLCGCSDAKSVGPALLL